VRGHRDLAAEEVLAVEQRLTAWVALAALVLSGIQLMVLAGVEVLVAMTLLLPLVLWELMVGTTVEAAVLHPGWERREALVGRVLL
jgi:membrane protein implicated in regulation of membrane protease activity